LGNICVIAGEGWSELSFIIDDFSVISLIKADIFSLFHRGAFPEKAVSTLILSFFCAEVRKSINLPGPRTYQISLVLLTPRILLLYRFISIALARPGSIFSLFHRGAFPEKAVSTLILSFSTFLGCRVICIYKDQ
jgi:hypothetical protein